MADEIRARAETIARKLWTDPEPNNSSTRRVWDVYFSVDEAAEDIEAALIEEAALARKQEREECVKAMCIYCRRGILLEGSCHRNSNGDFLDVCRALAIHAGNGEEKG